MPVYSSVFAMQGCDLIIVGTHGLSFNAPTNYSYILSFDVLTTDILASFLLLLEYTVHTVSENYTGQLN